MTSEQAVRGWTDLFKRKDKRDEAAAVPAAAAAPDPVVHSHVFPHFFAALKSREAPTIVDLGPVVGPNIAFFGERLACKIHIEDVVADIEDHARRGQRERLSAFMASRLHQAAGSIDGVLCWDIFDFLDLPAGRVLAISLTRILKPGGVLYGSFGTTAAELRQYTRTAVESPSVLRPHRYPATPVSRTLRVTRDIIKMFDGLVVAESVLLKSHTREMLFRKS